MKRRRTYIAFAVFGLVLAVALWLSTRGRDPLLRFGFEPDVSSWEVEHFVTIDPIQEGLNARWHYFALGPISITIRRNSETRDR